MARRLVSSLYNNLPESLKSNIDERDLLCVQIAALIHDLGHGPFSHLWDSTVVKNEQGEYWTHEKGSCKLFKLLLEEENTVKNKFSEFGIHKTSYIDFVCEMIESNNSTIDNTWNFKSRPESLAWMFEIVSNKRSGIDVDRLDYLCRDSRKVGFEQDAQNITNRYIEFARVNIHPGTKRPIITIPQKDLKNVWFGIFQLRFRLHNTLYQHPAVCKIETMYKDVLRLSEGIYLDRPGFEMELSRMHTNIKKYAKLNESVFNDIAVSTSKEFEKARQLLKRIDQRKLYTLIGRVEYATVDIEKRLCSTENFKEIIEKIVTELGSHGPARK